MGDKPTRVEKFVRWCSNNKIISVVIITALIFIALGNFTDALDKIHNFFKSNSPPNSNTNSVTEAQGQWQPPELPKDCRFISIISGGGESTQELQTNREMRVLATAYQDSNGNFHP